MPYAPSDGARLYYEESGTGYPVVFVHEFSGDHRSWESQNVVAPEKPDRE
jgi:pimeloyl-ACP methyl ester carboxylesterase